MADEKRTALLAQVAHMYHEQSATQEAIAASLSISRPTVSRLLKEARAEGVVQIIINTPFQYVPELEAALGQAFRTSGRSAWCGLPTLARSCGRPRRISIRSSGTVT